MKSESGDMGVPAPLFSNIFIVVSGVPGSSITSGTTSCNAADLSVELKVAGAAPVFVTVTVFRSALRLAERPRRTAAAGRRRRTGMSQSSRCLLR